MSLAWKSNQERSHRWIMRLFRGYALFLGRPFARLILYPIILYYYCFEIKANRMSKKYLKCALNRPVKTSELLKYYFYFASMLLDRPYFVSNKFSYFKLNIQNSECVKECIEKKTGCIMLGSHLGSFEALRCLALDQFNAPVKIIMDGNISTSYNELLLEINPELRDTIIDMNNPNSIFIIKETLDQGGIVGILGDRAVDNKKNILCDFLNKAAAFPTGPILMASVLKAPVNLFFGVYAGKNRYSIIFERFANSIIIERKERQEQVEYWVKRYVKRLEYYTKKYPFNWFNFYDFWNEQEGN